MRRLAICAALGAIAGGTLAAPAQAVSPDQIMSVLNAERTANGLPPLKEDPALSAGCAAHNNYAMQNGSAQTGFFFRDEDPMAPGYTPEGDEASHNSQFSAGNRPVDSFANGNPFDTAPAHLFNLMEPARKTVGVDQLDFNYGAYGTISLICIDIRSAPRRPLPKRRFTAYAYLGPDGSTPESVDYVEGPGAGTPGAWVFFYFTAPKRTTVVLRSLRVKDSDGKDDPPAFQFESGGLKVAGTGRKRPRASTGCDNPNDTPPCDSTHFGSLEPAGGFKLDGKLRIGDVVYTDDSAPPGQRHQQGVVVGASDMSVLVNLDADPEAFGIHYHRR